MKLELNNLNLEERKKIGNRIKGARIMVGLTQEEFSEKYSISLSTLKNFEFARFVPRVATVISILDALRSEGIAVDERWLVTGRADITSNAGVPDTFQPNKQGFKESVALCKYMTSQGLNPVSCTIANNDMAPNYLKGDDLVGVPIEKESLVSPNFSDRPYLVEINSSFEPYFIIKDGNNFYAVNNAKTRVIKIKNERIARIAWHCHFRAN